MFRRRDEGLNADEPLILQAGGKEGQTGEGLVYGDGKSDPPPIGFRVFGPSARDACTLAGTPAELARLNRAGLRLLSWA